MIFGKCFYVTELTKKQTTFNKIENKILFLTSSAQWGFAPQNPFCCQGSDHVTSKTYQKRLHDTFYYRDF